MRKQEQKGKITALYERLSHDDGRSDESVSVENQKRILEDYARKNGFTNVRHFTDDGVRGTTFKRPGLDAMVDEIRAGNVATVIVKDQSRIGRDVVEVGLLKRTFDEYNVRFIAANDNLDTANGFDIMSIFRDVINEWYVADTSRKIKTVFKSRMEKGLRCSGAVPYGYLASKEPAKPLEVCPEGKEYSEGNGIFSVTPVSTAQGRGLAITFFKNKFPTRYVTAMAIIIVRPHFRVLGIQVSTIAITIHTRPLSPIVVKKRRISVSHS